MQSAFKETKIHGKDDFPYDVYNCYLPKFFTYFPLHWHDEYEIIYIFEGPLKVNIQGIEYLGKEGDMFLIPPNFIHSIQEVNDEKCHYCNILFKFSLLENDVNSGVYKKYFEPFMDGKQKDVFFNTYSEVNKILTSYVIELFDCRHEKFSTDELKVKANLFRIMFEIKNLCLENEKKSEVLDEWVEKIRPLLAYIKENFAKEISVEEAAEFCQFSKSHFMKIFKNVTGDTFLDYVKKCRLEHAYYLLRESEINIEEIGQACGFYNFSYFIRAFKSVYGKSPLQFRKFYKKEYKAKK